MARSDIRSDGEFVPTEVGRNIYVWMRKGAKKPSGERACVITSHGMDIDMEEIIGAAYPPPDVDLYFYSPHGFALPDNSVEGVMTRKTKWYERVAAKSAKFDYNLTKAQGSHSAVAGHETYGHIQVGFHPQGRMECSFKLLMSEMESASKKKNAIVRSGMKSAALDAFANELERMAPVVLDVVTVRNRQGFFKGQVTLFSAAQLLKKNGFHYSEIHCNFCRGAKAGHKMTSNTESIGR